MSAAVTPSFAMALQALVGEAVASCNAQAATSFGPSGRRVVTHG